MNYNSHIQLNNSWTQKANSASQPINLEFNELMRQTTNYPAVADPEFYNGSGRSRGGVLGGPPQKKMNFYLTKVDFGAF